MSSCSSTGKPALSPHHNAIKATGFGAPAPERREGAATRGRPSKRLLSLSRLPARRSPHGDSPKKGRRWKSASAGAFFAPHIEQRIGISLLVALGPFIGQSPYAGRSRRRVDSARLRRASPPRSARFRAQAARARASLSPRSGGRKQYPGPAFLHPHESGGQAARVLRDSRP